MLKTTKQRKHKRQSIAVLLLACTLCGIVVIQWQNVWWFYQRHLERRGAYTIQPRTATAAHIVEGARAQEGTYYNASYRVIDYPNGDVPVEQGACTDVVVRALRHAGYDLQRLMHEDMQRNFNAYPHRWGLDKPDSNIDHRRVPNQIIFLKRHGLSLTTQVTRETLPQWKPGDFVYWNTGGGRLHTGVLSNTCNRKGVPFVIHNGSVCMEEDCLTQWKIIGHFRYPKPRRNINTHATQQAQRVNSRLGRLRRRHQPALTHGRI